MIAATSPEMLAYGLGVTWTPVSAPQALQTLAEAWISEPHAGQVGIGEPYRSRGASGDIGQTELEARSR